MALLGEPDCTIFALSYHPPFRAVRAAPANLRDPSFDFDAPMLKQVFAALGDGPE